MPPFSEPNLVRTEKGVGGEEKIRKEGRRGRGDKRRKPAPPTHPHPDFVMRDLPIVIFSIEAAKTRGITHNNH